MGEIELGAAAEATIHAYRELATAPDKRLALASDQTCIQFLAYVIAEAEGSLVKSAIDTLSLLAETPDCRPRLACTFGVLESLQSIADDESKFDENIRNQATALFTCLQFSKHIKRTSPSGDASSSNTKTSPSTTRAREKERPESVQSNCSTTSNKSVASNSERTASPPDRDMVDSTETEPKSIGSDTSKSNVSSVHRKNSNNNSNSKAKTITLFIKGMIDPDQRTLVEDRLVRVRGLISIVFDLPRSRVTCRVKKDLSIEKLAVAVEKTETMKALQIISNSDGQEEMISIREADAVNTSSVCSPIESLPDYLSEEETEIEDSQTAMASTSSFRETASSIFSTAASLLQKSFYW